MRCGDVRQQFLFQKVGFDVNFLISRTIHKLMTSEHIFLCILSIDYHSKGKQIKSSKVSKQNEQV